MSLLEEISKQPKVFEFNPDYIKSLSIYYYEPWKKLGCNPWLVTISFTKDNVTSEVEFKGDSYQAVYAQLSAFLKSL